MLARNPDKSPETKQNKTQLLSSTQNIIRISIALCFTLGVIDIAGWIFGITWLKSMGTHWIPMKVITALCFIFISLALTVLFKKQSKIFKSSVPFIAGIFLIVVSSLTIFSWFYLKGTGHESSVIQLPVLALFLSQAARMALLTAFLFFSLGIILILLNSDTPAASDIAHVLCFPAAFAGFMIPVSYLLNVLSIHDFLGTPVALNTGIAFCAVCLAVYLIRPDTWLMRVFTSGNTGGFMARRLLPWLILVPVIIAWLRIRGEHSGIFSSEIGVLLVAITYTFCFVLLIWLTARSVNLIDNKRQIADEALKKSWEELEKKVRERTSQLMEVNKKLESEIKERVKAEELVREERQRINNLLELMPAYVILLSPDYHVSYSNRVFRERFGESHGKRCFEFLFNRTEPCEICETFKVLKENKPLTWEWTGPDGNIYSIYDYPFRDSDGSTLIMEVGIEITSLRKAEGELRTLNAELEQRVSERSSRLNTVVSNIDSSILFVGEDKIELANQNFCDYFGLRESPDKLAGISAEEMIGKIRHAYLEPEKQVDRMREIVAAGQKVTNEEVNMNNGRTCLRDFIPLQMNDKLHGRLWNYIDITDRKKAELDLLRSKQEWVETFDKIPDLIAIIDKEHRIVKANKAMLDKLAFRNDLNESNQCFRCVHGTDKPPAFCPHSLTLRDGKQHMAEVHEERLGGDFIVSDTPMFDDYGNYIASVHVARDITDLKKTGNLLKESEARFRTITESLPVMISITRISDSTIRFTNELYERTFGYGSGQLIGMKARDMDFNPEDRVNIMNLLKESGTLQNLETKVKKADGTAFWIMASIQTITFENEPAYLSAIIDITESKRAQIELIQLNRTMNSMSKSSQAMIHSQNEQQYLEEVCRIITEECGHTMVWIGYAQNDRNKSVIPVAFSGFEEGYLNTLNITWADTERGKGPTGTVIRTGKVARCTNMQTDPAFAPWRKEAIKRGYNSSLVLPLKSDNKPFGALNIYSKETGTFTAKEIALLSEIADDLAYGITNIRLAESEKKAVTKIKENEEKYRLLFETMTEGFALHEIITDDDGQPVDYRFLSVNPAFEKQTGLKCDNLVGKKVTEVLPGTEKYWIETYGKVALTGESIEFENYHAGLNKYFRVSSFCPNKGYFAAIFENITDRVLAENELQRTKNYLENLINYANAPIIVWNPDTEIVLFNHAFEHLTGYLSTEVEGKKLNMLFPKGSLKESNAKIKRALTENWRTIEIPILTKNDEIRTVLWNSANIYDTDNKTIISTIAQGNDITDRIAAEHRVKESKEKLDLALENAKIGIWEWDLRTDDFELDDRMAEMFGIKKHYPKVKYSSFEKFIYEEDIPHFRMAIRKTVDENIPFESVFRIRAGENEFNHISLKALVEKDNNGKPVKMTGVCFDITDMKKGAEQALFRINEDLVRSNRELEQFAYVASHDLQEPLRMVSSFTQLLSQRYKDKLDQDAQEFIRYAVEGAVRMQLLINDLLNYSRIETRGKKFSEVDMHNVIGQVVKNLSLNIKEKNALITNSNLPFVIADEGQMIHLFQNLIGNALKFCDTSPRIHVSASEQADCFLFSVKDNGIGIENQYFEKIFQIFQRLHPKDEYGGTGIGLAICSRIVGRHGGKIWVESKPGKGSVFYFTIKKV